MVGTSMLGRMYMPLISVFAKLAWSDAVSRSAAILEVPASRLAAVVLLGMRFVLTGSAVVLQGLPAQ